jgi:diaminopimelate epimerase
MEEIDQNKTKSISPVDGHSAAFSASSSASSSECTHSRASSSVLAGGKYELIRWKNVGNDKPDYRGKGPDATFPHCRGRLQSNAMQFTKMHGIGNDYIYVNGFAASVSDPAALARKISDRHTGVGADGLILILPSTRADVRMQMFNADGSEAEMCGNGIRCLAKYVFDHGISKKSPLRVETWRGVLSLSLKTVEGIVREITVNMSQPILELEKVPVDLAKIRTSLRPNEYQFQLGGSQQSFNAVFVSMGNPHAVMYVEDVSAIDLDRLGPQIEHHPAFPRRMNAHWVAVHSRGEVTMRTWERGSGITLACGTGACAVCVAGVRTGRTDRKILAHLPGGDLTLEWSEADNNVYMTGPAVEIFTGEWPENA